MRIEGGVASNKVILPNEIVLDHALQMIEMGHTVTLNVRGDSMMPLLRSDLDGVVLSRVVELRKGQIVLAMVAPKCYVLHRIIEIKGHKIDLMGDGNLRQIEECLSKHVLAQAITILRGSREHQLSGVWCVVYGRIWMALKPIRRYLIAICRRV